MLQELCQLLLKAFLCITVCSAFEQSLVPFSVCQRQSKINKSSNFMKNIKPEVNLNHPGKLRVIEASRTELLLIQGAVTISVQGLEDGLRLGIGCLLWVKIALSVRTFTPQLSTHFGNTLHAVECLHNLQQLLQVNSTFLKL